MKRIKNLFPEIYDFENLFLAYKEARKHKRDRPDVMKYSDNLEENLITSQNELMWKTYKAGPYRQFFINEPKRRLIMSLPFYDKVIQHAIYRKLSPLIDKKFIYDSYAGRKGKGNHKAVERLQYWMKKTERKPQKYYYLKMDISKYYYRIDHEILKKILRKHIADKDLLDILSGIIQCEETKFGLPEGVGVGDIALDEMLKEVGIPPGELLSEIFAEVYLNELDQFCKHNLKLRYYIRYRDDIVTLHHDKKYLQRVKQEIEDFLDTKLRLKLNRKTCIRPVSMGIEFVGFRIWPTHRKLRKQTAKRMVKRLKYAFAAYRVGEMSRGQMKRKISSYKGLLKHCNSHGLKKKINKLYKKEMKKNDGDGMDGNLGAGQRDIRNPCGGRNCGRPDAGN